MNGNASHLSDLVLRRLARHIAIEHENVTDTVARRLRGQLIPLLQDADALLDAATRAHFEALHGGRRFGPAPEHDARWPQLRSAMAEAGLSRFIAAAPIDAAARSRALAYLKTLLATLDVAGLEAVVEAVVHLALGRTPGNARAFLDTILHELTKETHMATPTFYIDTSTVPGLSGTAAQNELRAAVTDMLTKRFGMSPDEANLNTSAKAAAIFGMVLLDEEYDFRSLSFFESLKRAWTESLQETRKFPPNGITTVPNAEVYKFVAEHIPDLNGGPDVSYQQLASVSRYAIENAEAIPFGHPNFTASVRIGLDRFVAGRPSGDSLTVPSALLSTTTAGSRDSEELSGPNIAAVGMIYTVALYERAFLFRAIDRIAEMFRFSWIAVGNDPAGRALDDYIWASEDRMNEGARMSEFGRVLGMPGGEVPKEVQPNTEFEQIFMRFISTVAEYDRQRRVSDILTPGRRSLTSTGEQVRKAARDLAANASLYGWAFTHFSARRLARHLESASSILEQPQILKQFNATSPWQVVERVAVQELGSTPNITKYRTMAEASREIFELLARKTREVALSTSDQPFLFELTPGVVSAPAPVPGVTRVSPVGVGDLTFDETEALLRNAQAILTVNGTGDDQVMRYAAPHETVNAPSLPQQGKRPADGDIADKLRQMVTSNNPPSIEQIRAMIPGMN